MTIIEALQKGKAFKRQSGGQIYEPDQLGYTLTKQDLLSGDWVLFEPQVFVTETKLCTAWEKIASMASGDPVEAYKMLRKELGL